MISRFFGEFSCIAPYKSERVQMRIETSMFEDENDHEYEAWFFFSPEKLALLSLLKEV